MWFSQIISDIDVSVSVLYPCFIGRDKKTKFWILIEMNLQFNILGWNNKKAQKKNKRNNHKLRVYSDFHMSFVSHSRLTKKYAYLKDRNTWRRLKTNAAIFWEGNHHFNGTILTNIFCGINDLFIFFVACLHYTVLLTMITKKISLCI